MCSFVTLASINIMKSSSYGCSGYIDSACVIVMLTSCVSDYATPLVFLCQAYLPMLGISSLFYLSFNLLLLCLLYFCLVVID